MIPIIDIGLKIIDKFIPDPAAKQAAQLKMLEMQHSKEFQEMEDQLKRDLGQMEVNKVEAESESLFKSGWRPAVGWVCVLGLFYNFIFSPLGTWIVALYGNPILMPKLDIGDLMTLLFGMLGLGAYRTFEKSKKVN